MAKRIHYPNAPITEATIDLRVVQSEKFSIEDLMEIRALVADSYPNEESEFVLSGEVHVKEDRPLLTQKTTNWHSGFRFTSRDEQRVFFARLDGFALSIRAPYDRWETFRDEARRLWKLYLSVAKVEGITRAAVRYINQLDITANAPDPEMVHLEDFVTVYPELPSSWPGGGVMRNFFMQVQIWQEDLGCWLIINEAPTQRSPEDDFFVLQLDFDFFREQLEEPWQDDDDVWQFLEQLHVRKNEVFEASITDATRRFIK